MLVAQPKSRTARQSMRDIGPQDISGPGGDADDFRGDEGDSSSENSGRSTALEEALGQR